MTTGNGMTGAEMVDYLTMTNRAYNLLYSLGESPVTVETLKPEEAKRLVDMARSAFNGEPGTMQGLLRGKVSPGVLRYVATGRMGE